MRSLDMEKAKIIVLLSDEVKDNARSSRQQNSNAFPCIDLGINKVHCQGVINCRENCSLFSMRDRSIDEVLEWASGLYNESWEIVSVDVPAKWRLA